MTTAPGSCKTNGKLGELRTPVAAGETNRWRLGADAISKQLLNFGRRRRKSNRLLVRACRNHNQMEYSNQNDRTSENKSRYDAQYGSGRDSFASRCSRKEKSAIETRRRGKRAGTTTLGTGSGQNAGMHGLKLTWKAACLSITRVWTLQDVDGAPLEKFCNFLPGAASQTCN